MERQYSIMGTLRIIDKSYFNEEFIKVYDSLVFSFDYKEVKDIIKNDSLSKVIRKQIIELRMNSKKRSEVSVGYYNKDIYAIYDIHWGNFQSRTISLFKIINLLKLNNFSNLAVFIYDQLELDISYNVFDFLTKEFNLNIDLVKIV